MNVVYDIEKFDLAEPDAASLILSLRAFGYDITTAIADLIDNSITAHASAISVFFNWNNGKPWIAVEDNGNGMTCDELVVAMKPGSKSPIEVRDSTDLGRFGLGLKTASFSQCRMVTVISKKDGDLSMRCWDLDVVKDTNKWLLRKEWTETASFLAQNYFNNRLSGTVVLWENLDRIIPKGCEDDEIFQTEFLNKAKAVKSHISQVFSTYMQGPNKIQFSINDNPIDLWDPFMLTCGATTKLPTESLYVNGKLVRVQPYVLPHHSRISKEDYSLAAGQTGWNGLQGFYVFRNNRLIVSGDWLLDNFEKNEQYKLARIRIDIDNLLDEEWAIDVKKSKAIPPAVIRNDLVRIAAATRRESARIYRYRGKSITRRAAKDKTLIWKQGIRNGKIIYSVNKDQYLVKALLSEDKSGKLDKLIELLEETIPVPLIISNTNEHPENIPMPYEGKTFEFLLPMMESLYNTFISAGTQPEDAIELMSGIEPFIYFPEQIELFKEKMEG